MTCRAAVNPVVACRQARPCRTLREPCHCDGETVRSESFRHRVGKARATELQMAAAAIERQAKARER